MLSNHNHSAAPSYEYGDETPVFMTDAVDENGETIMLPTTSSPDFVDIDYRVFSARSVIANGNKLLPSDSIQGLNFNQMNARDRVVDFVEKNVKLD